jgi:hypothetical protein
VDSASTKAAPGPDIGRNHPSVNNGFKKKSSFDHGRLHHDSANPQLLSKYSQLKHRQPWILRNQAFHLKPTPTPIISRRGCRAATTLQKGKASCIVFIDDKI